MIQRNLTQISEESKAAIERARSLFCAADGPFADVPCSDDQIVYLALTAWIAELDRERLAEEVFGEQAALVG